MHLTFRDVKTVAQGRWGNILSNMVGGFMNDAIESGPRKHSMCPIHGGKKPFRIFKDFEYTGGCICSQCGSFGDGFAFLQEKYSWSSRESLEQVASYLGLVKTSWIETKQPLIALKNMVKPPKVTPEEIGARRLKIKELWSTALRSDEKGAEPLTHYFLNRGLGIGNIPEALRLVLSHGYYDDDAKFIGNYSVMLAPVLNSEGICVALHRTYLTANGMKAPVEYPEKLYTKGSSLKGAAIRLFPAEETLGLCEGIETGIAVNEMTQMAVWPCVSAALLKAVQLPKIVKRVYLWSDKDRSKAGQEATEELAHRLYDEGKEVIIKIPELNIPQGQKSIDWLDVYNLQQSSFLRRRA